MTKEDQRGFEKQQEVVQAMTREEFWEHAYKQDIHLHGIEYGDWGILLQWSWPTIGFGELRLSWNTETQKWDAMTEMMSDRCVAHIMQGFVRHVTGNLNNLG